MISARAARFAAAYALLRSAADVADHWIQTDHQARTKGQHDGHEGQSSAAGRAACAAHVAAYVATQGLALWGGARLLGVRLRPVPVAAALTVSAVTHYAADRREPLRRLAEATGKGDFYALGADVVDTSTAEDGITGRHLGRGSYALDQAWHHGWETVAALIASA
ncbi:transcriptional regulator [Kitasatospora sp. NPDC051984]|uniref:transcriptional regulator n=1 Tax=Kitasatospora sp. NPDC051984 TaxID=3364059 RepID=UPI0037C84551